MARMWFYKPRKKFVVDVCQDGIKRRFYLARTRKESRRLYRQLMEKLERDEMELERSERPAVERLVDDFLEHIHNNRTEATYNQYRYLLSEFARRFVGRAAETIGPADLEKFKRALVERDLSPNTINRALQVVRAMYNWATEFGYVGNHQLGKLRLLPKESRPPRFLSPGEIEALLRSCSGDLKDIVLFFLCTGMRLSELANLDWNDVDLENRQITIGRHKASRTMKQPAPRTIPLSNTVLAILQKRQHRKGLVFPNGARRAYDKDSLRHRFDRAKRKAGLKDITIHTLRHTFASMLTMQGENLQTIAALLGHTTTRTTEIYAHLAPEHLRRAVNALHW